MYLLYLLSIIVCIRVDIGRVNSYNGYLNFKVKRCEITFVWKCAEAVQLDVRYYN